MIYDISRTASPTLQVWPGDTPYSLAWQARIADGASVNLSTLTMSAHTGSHADAYLHTAQDAADIASMPLGAYIGPAQVVTVTREAGALQLADFDHVDLRGGERLLVHSAASDLPDEQWPDAIVYPSPELIAWLAGMGYRLIGMDAPSVDTLDSQHLPGHAALRQYGMANLEHLNLRDVPDGHYELVALPLKLAGACASPVRAILRTSDI